MWDAIKEFFGHDATRIKYESIAIVVLLLSIVIIIYVFAYR